jgi:DnaJ family protein C protein 28
MKREKQYQKFRAVQAAANVHEHRVMQAIKETDCEETAVVKDKRAAKKIMTSFGMDRMVEDMIQESMARGEFSNLSGQGKPLKHDSTYNPYIDFTTHKLNQVLIDNGFTPEWILLEKEIRQEIASIRESILKRRHKYEENLDARDEYDWQRFLEELKPTCDQLNAKIQKYNLLVPTIYKQILCIQLDRESKKALSNFSPDLRKAYLDAEKKRVDPPVDAISASGETLIGYLMSVLRNK